MKAIVTEIQVGGCEIVQSLGDAVKSWSRGHLRDKMAFTILLGGMQGNQCDSLESVEIPGAFGR